MNAKQTGKDLMNFVSKAITPFHCVIESEAMLREAGFTELPMRGAWDVKEGGKYFVAPFPTCVFAFAVGEEARGLHIASAHTDYPCLHVKPAAELTSKSYLRVNVEVYGGAILNTWLDRPLSIAGRAMLRSSDIYAPEVRVVDFKKPVLTIPNLPIHYNREVNKGVELTKQNDMLPLIGMLNKKLNEKSFFIDFLAKELGCKSSDILDFDLYIYNPEKPCFVGMNEEFISAPRLDNQTSCFALLRGIIDSKCTKGINVIALFDNEEIGSTSKQGADSTLLPRLLRKLYKALGKTEDDFTDDIMAGFLISADVAHAVHPAHGEKYDSANNALMNDGVVLKLSINQRYSYDNEAVAVMQQLLDAGKVPYKKFVNHSDAIGGGTLGPIISSITPMRTVDVGVPILAMHSSRELMGTEDQQALNDMIRLFFD